MPRVLSPSQWHRRLSGRHDGCAVWFRSVAPRTEAHEGKWVLFAYDLQAITVYTPNPNHLNNTSALIEYVVNTIILGYILKVSVLVGRQLARCGCVDVVPVVFTHIRTVCWTVCWPDTPNVRDTDTVRASGPDLPEKRQPVPFHAVICPT